MTYFYGNWRTTVSVLRGFTQRTGSRPTERDADLPNRDLLAERGFVQRTRDRLADRKLMKRHDPFLLGLNGVIHVGANAGQERAYYDTGGLSVVWVEAIPKVFAELSRNVLPYPRQRALNYLLSDVDGQTYDFKIANNEAESSSIFDLSLHAEVWPHVHYVDHVSLSSTRFDTMVEAEKVDIERYEALVMDTQGSELLVLKGAADLLRNFRFIKTEAADFEIYAGGAHLSELTDYLDDFGFSEWYRWKFADGPSAGTGCYDIVYRRR